jgi:hypothetical protein
LVTISITATTAAVVMTIAPVVNEQQCSADGLLLRELGIRYLVYATIFATTMR